MSSLRIQNEKGDDLVSIDLNTGSVVLRDNANNTLQMAAATWWKAVAMSYEAVCKEYKCTYKDLVLRAAGKGNENDGDIIFRPGEGVKEGRGGNVTVATDTACPECHSDPRGVLLLDKYHPCKRCAGRKPPGIHHENPKDV